MFFICLGRKRKWFTLEDALQELSQHKPVQLTYLQSLLTCRNEKVTWNKHPDVSHGSLNLLPPLSPSTWSTPPHSRPADLYLFWWFFFFFPFPFPNSYTFLITTHAETLKHKHYNTHSRKSLQKFENAILHRGPPSPLFLFAQY